MLSAAERRTLINKPFPPIRHVYPMSYPWAGVMIEQPELTPEKVLARAGEWIGQHQQDFWRRERD